MPDDNTFELLRNIVERTHCKKGWQFRLSGCNPPLVLHIRIDGYNNIKQDEPFRVTHCFPVPCACYNEKSWTRWLFEMCRRVENHELGECFRVDDHRPFLPLHGPGEDPYTVHEYRDRADALVRQDGSIMEEE